MYPSLVPSAKQQPEKDRQPTERNLPRACFIDNKRNFIHVLQLNEPEIIITFPYENSIRISITLPASAHKVELFITITAHNMTQCLTGKEASHRSTHLLDLVLVNGGNRHVVRCDRNIVLSKCGELWRIVNAVSMETHRGNLSIYEVHQVNVDLFERMIRFVENDTIELANYMDAVALLRLADRFECCDLVIHCVRYIDNLLCIYNVIDIFRAVWRMKLAYERQFQEYEVVTKEPKAKPKHAKVMPPIPLVERDKRYIETELPLHTYYVLALLNNAHQLIITQADKVLRRTYETNLLNRAQMDEIATQDSLQLSSEKVLYGCLSDWSVAECGRQDIPPSEENCRRVLGKLRHTPRYLLMTVKEFSEAVLETDLLEPNEFRIISDHLIGRKRTALTVEDRVLYEKFRTFRPEFPRMPIHLSQRSHPSKFPRAMRRADERSSSNEAGWRYWLNECYALICCVDDES